MMEVERMEEEIREFPLTLLNFGFNDTDIWDVSVEHWEMKKVTWRWILGLCFCVWCDCIVSGYESIKLWIVWKEIFERFLA